jgi:2'-5' RNA ligase
MRLFFALWPPREAAAALHAWALRASGATGGRATRADSIHLTLAFLGKIDAGRLAELKGLHAAGGAHTLPIEQARHWVRKRIVWAGPKETPDALRALAGTLTAQLAKRNFPTEARPFAAHVTLIRNTRGPGDLPALPEVDWPVREFLLVRSHLSAQAPSYETLARYALA